jgi:hypothetical protein
MMTIRKRSGRLMTIRKRSRRLMTIRKRSRRHGSPATVAALHVSHRWLIKQLKQQLGREWSTVHWWSFPRGAVGETSSRNIEP